MTEQIDWRLVRQWTGVDVLVIGGNTSGSLERPGWRCSLPARHSTA